MSESFSTLLARSTVPAVVNNRLIETSKTFNLTDPHNNQKVLHKVTAADGSTLDEAVKTASDAFPAWSKTSPQLRRKVLLRAAALMSERLEDLKEIVSQEATVNKVFIQFQTEIMIKHAEDIAAAITDIKTETAPGNDKLFVQKCPYGVIFSIAPWNGALVLCSRAFSNPIAGGNTVVLKGSEYSPKTHLAIYKCYEDALSEYGFKGVVNLVQISPEDAPTLIPRVISAKPVRKINFTGSCRVGKIIGHCAAENLKPAVLEMGGKAPMIVMADANLDLAASAATFSGFANSGQICMSLNNLLVHRSIFSEFKSKFAKLVNNLTSGPDPSYDVRGLFTYSAASRVQSLIQDALDKGAKVVAGEFKIQGSVVSPVVLEGINKDMRIWTEENFGPVVSLIPYDTTEEAVDFVNDSEYGLTASVWTTDDSEGWRVGNLLEAAAIQINGPTVNDPEGVPKGAWKSSGWGPFNGIDGILEYMQVRVIDVRHGKNQPLYPLTKTAGGR